MKNNSTFFGLSGQKDAHFITEMGKVKEGIDFEEEQELESGMWGV